MNGVVEDGFHEHHILLSPLVEIIRVEYKAVHCKIWVNQNQEKARHNGFPETPLSVLSKPKHLVFYLTLIHTTANSILQLAYIYSNNLFIQSKFYYLCSFNVGSEDESSPLEAKMWRKPCGYECYVTGFAQAPHPDYLPVAARTWPGWAHCVWVVITDGT